MCVPSWIRCWAMATRLSVCASSGLLLRTLRLIINDSVLGSLFKIPRIMPGITFGNMEKHVGSAAVTFAGEALLKSRSYINYWNNTDFFCGKWGSMKLHEGYMAPRYQKHCWTYANDPKEFSNPTSGPHHLPFYKHKNQPNGLQVRWVSRTCFLLPNITWKEHHCAVALSTMYPTRRK